MNKKITTLLEEIVACNDLVEDYTKRINDACIEYQLERKKDMKRRGLALRDNGRASALTFAYPILAPGAAPRLVASVRL